MVKIMLSSMPQQRQETVRVGEISPKGVGHARFQQHGEDVGWGQTLAGQDTSSYPAECILWCTIALGALVQGCPSTFVSSTLPQNDIDSCGCIISTQYVSIHEHVNETRGRLVRLHDTHRQMLLISWWI